MEMKCTNCKCGNVSGKMEKYKYKITHIWCKKLNIEIPIKRYEKMNFCLYHERKEDR